jgi:hypothetical protein
MILLVSEFLLFLQTIVSRKQTGKFFKILFGKLSLNSFPPIRKGFSMAIIPSTQEDVTTLPGFHNQIQK